MVRANLLAALSVVIGCSSDPEPTSGDAGRSIIPRGDAGAIGDGASTTSRDSGQTTTGAVTLEQVSYAGSSSSGSFSFVVANGTNRPLTSLTQVRVSFAGASGDMVFTVDNCKGTPGSAWSAAPGSKSGTVNFAAEDLTIPDRAALRVVCQSGFVPVVGNGPGASNGAAPSKLELRGAHDDASKWAASAAVL